MNFASKAIDTVGSFFKNKALMLSAVGVMAFAANATAQQKKLPFSADSTTTTKKVAPVRTDTAIMTKYSPKIIDTDGYNAKKEKKSKHGLGFFIGTTGGAQQFYPDGTRPLGVTFGVKNRMTKLVGLGAQVNVNLGGKPTWGYGYQFNGLGYSGAGGGSYRQSEVELTANLNPIRTKHVGAGIFAGMRGGGASGGWLNFMGPMAGARVMVQTKEDHHKVGGFLEVRAGVKQYNQWDNWFNFNADRITGKTSTPFVQATLGMFLPVEHKRAKNPSF